MQCGPDNDITLENPNSLSRHQPKIATLPPTKYSVLAGLDSGGKLKGMQHEFNWAAKIIKKAVENEKLRSARGAIRRKQMMEAIDRGETPTGPRAVWLAETADAVIKTLSERAVSFNEENLDDLISANDLGDALITAIRWLQAAGNSDKPQPTEKKSFD